MGACARFKIEGFEVLSPGLFLKSKGSRFERACSIPRRRVRGSVVWVLFTVEGFEAGARFWCMCPIQSRRVRGLGRLGSLKDRRARSLGACNNKKLLF